MRPGAVLEDAVYCKCGHTDKAHDEGGCLPIYCECRAFRLDRRLA